MSKLKVLDFDYGCGGFTKGLEDSGLFEVVYNGSINDKNKLCYNNTHINEFSELDLIKKDVDLAVFTPFLGHRLLRVGYDKFTDKYLNNLIALCSVNNFDNIIFVTQVNAIPFLQYSSNVFYTFDELPTIDIISCRLIGLGYNVFNFVLDGAGFGLAQHKFYNIYWASKTSEENILIKEGFGYFKRKYRQVQHVIGDIRDDSKLNHHNPNYKKRELCSLVKPGGQASNTKELSQMSGYVRLDANNMTPTLLYDFYNVSSKGGSINPWYDRPLTIREGARLFGLSDDFIWDNKLSNREIGLMLYESFPPVISNLMANKISKCINE